MKSCHIFVLVALACSLVDGAPPDPTASPPKHHHLRSETKVKTGKGRDFNDLSPAGKKAVLKEVKEAFPDFDADKDDLDFQHISVVQNGLSYVPSWTQDMPSLSPFQPVDMPSLSPLQPVAHDAAWSPQSHLSAWPPIPTLPSAPGVPGWPSRSPYHWGHPGPSVWPSIPILPSAPGVPGWFTWGPYHWGHRMPVRSNRIPVRGHRMPVRGHRMPVIHRTVPKVAAAIQPRMPVRHHTVPQVAAIPPRMPQGSKHSRYLKEFKKKLASLIRQILMERQQVGGSICSLPKETGWCRAAFPRFYFDVETGQCKKFTYGGCRGNANNFSTLDKCLKTCMPDSQPPSVIPPPDGLHEAMSAKYQVLHDLRENIGEENRFALSEKYQGLHDLRENIGEEDRFALSEKFQLLKDMREALISSPTKSKGTKTKSNKPKKTKKSKRVKKSKGKNKQ